MRSLIRPLDRSDPQILHHLYGFQRVQLPAGSDDIDAVPDDPEVVRAIRTGPRGFPTPNLGYCLPVVTAAPPWFSGKSSGHAPPALLPTTLDAYLSALQSLGLSQSSGGLPRYRR